MQKNIIKYAINKTTQKVEHIDNVANGLNCGCVCADCNNEMEAIQGEKREWHFRHHIDSKCKGGLETAIHKLAKEIIVNNTKIEVPNKTLYYSEAQVEVKLETYVPDVSVLSEGEPVYIEIYVCHKVEPEKEKFYKNKKLNSFEIDLSKVSYKTTEKELEELVLKTPNNKRVIYWEGEFQPLDIENSKEIKNNHNQWLGWLVVLGVLCYLFKRKKRY